MFKFFFCNESIWLVHLSKKWNYGGSQNWRHAFEIKCYAPLTHLHRWKEDNNCQSIWDKSEVLLGTLWGTCQELGKSLVWAPPRGPRPLPPWPPTHKKKREDPSLHDSTSHWMHGNSIPKIACHYFWPGLVTVVLPKNTPPIVPKRKNQGPLWVHAEPSHWLHEISLSKIVHHHFPSGLIPPL